MLLAHICIVKLSTSDATSGNVLWTGKVRGRWVGSPKGCIQHGHVSLAIERPWLLGWVGHSLLLCANGLRKQSCSLVEPPFLATKFLSQSTQAIILAESNDYWKLINKWVWLESLQSAKDGCRALVWSLCVNAGRSKMLAAKACIGVMYPTQAMPLMILKRQAVTAIVYSTYKLFFCMRTVHVLFTHV